MLNYEEKRPAVRQKFSAAFGKYVPSSLSEIQAGTTLESAKYSRVSFDPDAIYDDDYENEVDNSKNTNAHPDIGVADVATALVYLVYSNSELIAICRMSLSISLVSCFRDTPKTNLSSGLPLDYLQQMSSKLSCTWAELRTQTELIQDKKMGAAVQWTAN